MKNLTPAQKRYLIQAYQIQMGCHNGIFFSLWTPGRPNTGRALLAKGLVVPASSDVSWPYVLSGEGYHVAKELAKDQVKA